MIRIGSTHSVSVRELRTVIYIAGSSVDAAGLADDVYDACFPLPSCAAPPLMLAVEPHPLLDLRAFVTLFPQPLGELAASAGLCALLSLEAAAPLASSDEGRAAVRDLLRQGGFKPTGRSKPASEYLIKAAAERSLTSINLAVDACNAVSLHSGLPISVIDLDLAQSPLHVRLAPPGAAYVFNQAGQTIDLGGLLCLFDAQGPCGSPVKDSQRTKTGPQTRRTLSLVWGTARLPGRAAEAELWYQQLLAAHGAAIEPAAMIAQGC